MGFVDNESPTAASAYFASRETKISLKAPIDNGSSDLFSTSQGKNRSPKFAGALAEPRVQRRIGLHHIAFLRGYFEGLDVAVLADQYLALGRDKKRGLAAKRWIVEELVAAARKRGDAVGARLLRLPAGALPELVVAAASDAVDLDSFREQVDPDGVYSESELVDLLKASSSPSISEPGAQTRRAQRNTRLRHRQRALLERLEHALAEPPRAHHPIRDWLDAALATRLARAGFNTLAELADVISVRGYRWYRHIPRVGEQASIRILQWMERNATDLDITLPEHARSPRKAWSAAVRERLAEQRAALRESIAPIEYFAPISPTAQSDRRVLLQWLLAFRSCPSTYRAYRTQAERLLLWTTLERGIGLAQLTASDVSAFFVFVTREDLPPEWRGPKAERQTAAWRPIEKCPSPSSIAIARRILKVAFDYLCAHGHCDVNPFDGPRDTPRRLTQHRAFADNIANDSPEKNLKDMDAALANTDEAGDPFDRAVALAREYALSKGIADSTRSSRNHALRYLRLAVVNTLLNATAWPLSTLVQLRTAHLRSAVPMEPGISGAELFLHDRKRLRRAQLNPEAMRLIADYLKLRDSLAASQPVDNAFLIGRHSQDEVAQVPTAITPNVLARAVTQYLRSQARDVPPDDSGIMDKHPVGLLNPIVFTSIRGYKRRARQLLRYQSRLSVDEEQFVKPFFVVDLRTFDGCNPA